MSNKETVISYLLKRIANQDKAFAAKTVEFFGIARSTVYHYLQELTESGVLCKAGTPTKYALVAKTTSFSFVSDGTLDGLCP